jgi:nucleoside-diphosphate-sugar epimerase
MDPSITHPNLIITGSSGLIGSALIDRVGTEFREFGLDREGPPHPPPATELVVDCDIASDESVSAALEEVRQRGGGRIASVVHLAAYYDFAGEPSPLYEEVTVRGTERLLRGLREFQVEQFIFSSTMLVHAPCEPGQRIDENWPIEPKWDYPKSKVQTEQLILAEHGTMPVVLLRIAGVYDDDCHSIPIANQIARIHGRQLISHVYPGDTARGQAFIHLEDLVGALVKTIERRAQLPSETVLLLGEDSTVSYDELQREIARLLHGEKWETRQIPKVVAKAGAWLQDALPGQDPFIKPWMIDLADDHYALNIERARELLGWTPRRSLRATLPEMIARLKADPRAWFEKNKLPVPGRLK